jgi:phage/plasmid-like protein (TIGR03299 family)
MFVARKLAWHGLGTFVPEAVHSDEALQISGLDWTVRLEDAYTEDGVKVPDTKLTRRSSDDRVLGVVGERYTVIQNHELFDFTDQLVEYGARYESAGSLRDGKNVFTTMVIEKPLNIEGDTHIPYLVMASSHDGSMATRALLTPVRVVCMNTLRLAVGSAHRSFTIRHTKSAPTRIEEARRTLGLSFEYYDKFEDEVRTLMAQGVTDKQFDDLIDAVWPVDLENLKGNTRVEKKRDEVKSIVLHDATVSPYRGTAWGALNAFNTWEQWHSPVRRTKNTSTTESVVRMERQALSVLRDSSGLTKKVAKMLVDVR